MNVIDSVIQLFVLFFALTVHEASHAWTASRLGDMTARSLGRVSLNPLAHIDPFGTVLLPILLKLIGAPVFGWAKPVPYNPFLLKNPKRDALWISLAGPAANILVAMASTAVLFILKLAAPGVSLFLTNFMLGHRGLPRGFYPLEGLALILLYSVLINLFLAIFNLIPIPPLDGSGVLSGFLSDQATAKYERLRPYGFIIIMGLAYLRFLDIIFQIISIFIFTIIRP